MSTYNGEKYIETQINSILNQKNVAVHLLIRDDGSTDNSVAIIKSYASADIELIEEKNVGCENSFKRLLQLADYNRFDYFAFADQDDVWFSEKLCTAIATIEGFAKPALYCANQIITDQYLNKVKLMIPLDDYSAELERMNENYFLNRHGCTMVWNRMLMKILSEINRSEMYLSYHDKWVNLVARTCGTVIVAKEPLQLYRIHNANVSGHEERIFLRIKKGIRLYWMRDNHCDLYAQDCVKFLKQHPEFKDNSEGQRHLYQVAHYRDSFKNRFALAFSSKKLGKNFLEHLFWRISILIAKY